MADLTITPSAVKPGANADTEDVTFGATIAAGDLVYKDAADLNRCKLADGNAGAAQADIAGVALNSGSADQPGRIQRSGDYTSGATHAGNGRVYVLSANPGKIADVADLAAGNFTKIWAVSKSSTVLSIVNRGAGTAYA